MKEIAFIIDSGSSKLQNGLVLRVIEGEKSGLSFLPHSKSASDISQLISHCSAKDAALLKQVINLSLSDKKNSTQRNPSTLLISPSKTYDCLKELASQGKIFTEDGKLIAADFYSKLEVSYTVTEIESKIKLGIHIKYRDLDFELKPTDLIFQGPPHFVYRPPLIRFFIEDVSYKELRWLVNKTDLLLSKQEYLCWLDAIDLEEDDPRLTYIHSFSKEIELPDPLPILMLKDRWGSFADLYLNYENFPLIGYHESKELEDISAKTKITRKKSVESLWEKDLLETGFIKKPMASSHYYCSMDQVGKSIAFLLELGWKVIDSQGRQVVTYKNTDCYVEAETDHFTIRGKVRFENYEADLKNVIGAFNKRERFIELGHNTVGLLPPKWENKNSLTEALSHAELVSTGYRLQKSQFGLFDHLSNLAKQDQANLEFAPDAQQLYEKLTQWTAHKDTSPSSQFLATLRPYQQKGLDWLEKMYHLGWGGILADDMGLGKTVQMLAFLSKRVDGPHLVVVPTSLIFNWQQEIQRFLPNISLSIFYGKERSYESNFKGIVLTSYSILRKDISFFEDIHFDTVILDEAQAIKNPSTQTAQAVYRLKAHSRFTVTGTPIENSLQELWAQFRFTHPSLLGSYSEFNQEAQSALVDFRYLERIRATVRPFILRRRKEDVAQDLPEKIEQTIFVEMDADQRTYYEEFLSKSRSSLIHKINLEGVKKHSLEVLEIILRLRQICCHPSLVSIDNDAPRPPSAKFNLVLEDLQTLISEKKKVLLFSQFSSMLKLFAHQATLQEWKYVLLDGSTPNREEVVAQFQNDPDTHLFLVSLKAGGVGLNLTAADYVLLYDPWWNEAAENQAIDRAHRIGRKSCVIAKRYITRESIEEKINLLKASKKQLADRFIEEAQLNEELSIEDLQDLLI